MRKTKLFLMVAATAAALGVSALLGAALVVYGGLYEVAATRAHWQPTHSLLQVAMRQSVQLRARGIAEPALGDERMALSGAACFQAKCVQCHGAPGVAQDDIGRSMQPLPGPLVDARQHWRPRELYWLVRHGLKMTGMPAWQYRLADGEIWDLVAFMQHLPELNAPQYAQWQERAASDAAMPPCGRRDHAPAAPAAPTAVHAAANALLPADAQRGRQALHQYACNSCHSIAGITGSAVFVGPPLERLARRGLIAGTLVNSPENLARWLAHTQTIKPGTAMPELGVAPQDARDMAAYLLGLH